MKNIPFTENEIKEITDYYSQELEKIQQRAVEIRGILQKMVGTQVSETFSESIAKGNKKNTEKSLNEIVSLLPTRQNEISKPSEPKSINRIITTVLNDPEKKAERIAAKLKKFESKAKKLAKAPKIITSKEGRRALKSANAEIKRAKIAENVSEPVVKMGRKKSTDSKKSQYESYILNLISKKGKFLTSKAIFDAVEKEFKVTAPDYSKMRATVTVILSKEKANGRLKDVSQPGTKVKLYGISDWYDNNGNLTDSSKLK